MKRAMILMFMPLLVVAMAQAMPVKVLMHLHCSDIPGDDGQRTLAFLAQKAANKGYVALIFGLGDKKNVLKNTFDILGISAPEKM